MAFVGVPLLLSALLLELALPFKGTPVGAVEKLSPSLKKWNLQRLLSCCAWRMPNSVRAWSLSNMPAILILDCARFHFD